MSVPKLRFPGFAGEWKQYKIGKIGPVAMCKRVLKEQTTPTGEIPFYKIGTFGREPDAFIERALFKAFTERYSFPKKGDILISAAGTIGRLVVFDGAPAYFQDSNIVWVANDETRVQNTFLYLCYQNVQWLTEDTTIARLYNENLRNIAVAAPTLPEQQKIAAFLGAVDARLAALAARQVALRRFKAGLMQKLFSQQLRFTREDGGAFPDWQEKRLGEVAHIVGGGTPESH
ncbi:MAG: restriction endonuclease subunit S, partial [Roseovarius sp.]|nr:restriction endonuclease subunit S [Roseovarius sp.]